MKVVLNFYIDDDPKDSLDDICRRVRAVLSKTSDYMHDDITVWTTPDATVCDIFTDDLRDKARTRAVLQEVMDIFL